MFVERMPNLYRSEKDLINRLGGTICRYKNEPVYVQVLSSEDMYLKDPVTMQLLHKIRVDDPYFDLSSPELGYMNLALPGKATPDLNVLYAERGPRRQFHQGLCSSNVQYSTLDGRNALEQLHFPGYPAGTWLQTPGFMAMLRDDYPTLDDAFEMLNDGFFMAPVQTKGKPPETLKINVKAIAISKSTAIERTNSGVYQVWFKTDNVGWIAPGDEERKTVHVKSDEMGWIVSRYLSQFSWKID